jgi:hypothetical protein
MTDITSAQPPPIRTPLFAAQQAPRYERQNLIAHYENLTGANLIVVCDQIFDQGITIFEDLLIGLDSARPLPYSLPALAATPK